MEPDNKLPDQVPCGLCETPTTFVHTRRCDRCWELETRIHSDPTLAERILNQLKDDKAKRA